MRSVVIYTTRFCPYCVRAKQLLTHKDVDFTEIAVDGNRELRRDMEAKSGRYTVPQIWVGDRHVGGCDDLYELERRGELNSLLFAP
jgi:glutaredoxin 3